MKLAISICALVVFSSCTTQNDSTMDSSTYLFTGTYTKKEGHVDGKGIGLEVFKLKNDQLTPVFTETDVVNPTFLEISSNGRRIYSANETGPDVGDAGSVSAFQILENGSLKLISTQSSQSFYPCHIVLDPQDRLAIVSNYAGGVAVLPITSNGGLESASQTLFFDGKGTNSRQEASHPHSVTISPNGKYAYVADLGTDKIMMFRINYDSNQLIPLEKPFAKLENEAGPRHMTFHPKMNQAYVINELNSTITRVVYNPVTGILETKESISTLPQDFDGVNHCADIHISEDGAYLYGSNRGHNSIAIFSIKADGTLEALGHEPVRGDHPRNFLIYGDELMVANQNTDNIVVFDIQDNGLLEFKYEFITNTPVCLKVVEM